MIWVCRDCDGDPCYVSLFSPPSVPPTNCVFCSEKANWMTFRDEVSL